MNTFPGVISSLHYIFLGIVFVRERSNNVIKVSYKEVYSHYLPLDFYYLFRFLNILQVRGVVIEKRLNKCIENCVYHCNEGENTLRPKRSILLPYFFFCASPTAARPVALWTGVYQEDPNSDRSLAWIWHIPKIMTLLSMAASHYISKCRRVSSPSWLNLHS